MKVQRSTFSSLWLSLIFAFVLMGFNSSFAQLEDLQELGTDTDSVKCKPDTLTTVYDKFASDSVDQQQVNIWYSLAREEYKYKNYKRAIPYYWKVLVNDKTGKFRVVYSKLADAYLNLNFPDSVFVVVYRGLEKYPDYTQLHYWAGIVHDRLGQYKCAIPQYEALTQAEPKQKSYWQKLAYLYYQVEDPKAIDAQQQVVALDPADVEAAGLLVDYQEHFGYDPLESMKKTFLIDTTNMDNAMRYAKAAFERGLYQDAIRPFKTIVRKEPKNTKALEYLGRCYEGLNQLNRALAYYKDILEIEPKNVNVLCLAASVYGRLNSFTTARSYVYKAEKIDPGNGLPHMIMAEIYENSVQYCSDQRADQKLTYDDKLVYRLSQEELKKAAKDPNYESSAKRRINQLEPLAPTTEDLFMHKNRLQPTDKCYSWI